MKQLITKLNLTSHIKNSPPRPKESGQSIIILAFAFMGLLAMLGIALDVGLVYVERVRLKRTVDAATLGAVPELPVEEAAISKAIGLIDTNGYAISDINVYVAGCVQDVNDIYQAGTANYGDTGTGSTDDLVNLPFDRSALVNVTDILEPDPNTFYPYIINGSFGEIPTFFIDTRSYQSREDDDGLCAQGQQISDDPPPADFGSANKLRVYGHVPVNMNFMQFFGFGEVPVIDSSVAENASQLDIALVMDSTGSMKYDTICFGCWERCGDSGLITDCDSKDRYKPYPTNGRTFPFPYPLRSNMPPPADSRQDRMLQLIVGDDGDDSVWPPTPGTPDPEPGKPGYIIFEAEFYSDNSKSWDPALRPLGNGYWAIQRQTYEYGERSGNDQGQAFAIDGYGYEVTHSSNNNTLTLNGLVRHHPMTENSDGAAQPFGKHYSQADAENNDAPRLEYDFVPTWGGNTSVHFKAQYYDGGNNVAPDNEFYYAIYRASDGANIYPGPVGGTNVKRMTGGERNDHWEPSPSREWDWIDDNTNTALTPGVKYTLKIWAGSGGYAFDRIIIADSNRNISSPDIRHDPATKGSAQRLAADPCNPIFGLNVVGPECTYMTLPGPTNNANDSLFGAQQPMRGSQQAMAAFAARLDPAFDQVGFVDFDNDAGQRAQLECFRASRNRPNGTNAPANQVATFPFDPADGYPNYNEYECSNPDRAETNSPGSVPISYTLVFKAIEDPYPPNGGTDIADGLRRGLHMLGITIAGDPDQNNDCEWKWVNSGGGRWQIKNGGSWVNQPTNGRTDNPSSHCARGSAATPVIILLTDGAPTNNNPGDNDDCLGWGELNPPPYDSFPSDATGHSENVQNKYECIMYYADIAAANGVIVYTIGLGPGADADLLGTVADKTTGQYYYAPTASQLNIIFDQILGNVYVRLVQ